MSEDDTTLEPYWQSQNRLLRLKPNESVEWLRSVSIRSQREVAKMMGVTPQCVQRTERRAIYKIRRMLGYLMNEENR